jgi:16S rRNA (guanine527-N7)-methyltransferase
MFHVKHEAWTPDPSALGLTLTRPQVEQLRAYEEELLEVAVPRGLIARSDRDRLWGRHIADGLRAALEIDAGASVLDLGSGAGIPGLPLGIVLSNLVTLAEARRGRVAFLESVVDRLGLPNVSVRLGKAEELDRRFDVCVARAFSSAAGTWNVAEPLLEPGGTLIYWAGERFEPSEIDELGVVWRVSTRSDLADPGPLVIMGRQ